MEGDVLETGGAEPNLSFTQGFSALWDADDFGDALYTFGAGLSTSVLKQIELEIELLDAYETKPPNELVKKNDVAFLTAVDRGSQFAARRSQAYDSFDL